MPRYKACGPRNLRSSPARALLNCAGPCCCYDCHQTPSGWPPDGQILRTKGNYTTGYDWQNRDDYSFWRQSFCKPADSCRSCAGFASPGAKRCCDGAVARSLLILAGEIGKQAIAIPCTCPFRRRLSAVETALGLLARDVRTHAPGVIEPDLAIFAASDPERVVSGHRYHLRASITGMRAVLPVMKNAGGGSILTIKFGCRGITHRKPVQFTARQRQ